jgi:potassium voltage-gated channel Eag-related subfamily H protein 7
MAVAVPDDDSSISSLAATDTPASAAAVVSPIRRPKPAITPEEREQMSKDMERLRKRLHYPAWLIIPDSPFSRRWDAAYVVFLLFTALVTPYEVALLDQVYWDGLFVVNRIVDLFFLCDMAVQFCSAFRDDNKKSDARLVVHHPTIVRRYLTTWFVWDLVSLIPYTLIGDLSGAPALGNLGALRFIRLLRLITLVRVVKASGMMRRYERKASLSHAQITLVKFGAAIVIMGHWMACLWCMVAALEVRLTE